MPVKLHRCKLEWLRAGACWRVEKALREMQVEYVLAPGPPRPSRRGELLARTGQSLYPAIEFENGVWYREESRDMAATIRAGALLARATLGAGRVRCRARVGCPDRRCLPLRAGSPGVHARPGRRELIGAERGL